MPAGVDLILPGFRANVQVSVFRCVNLGFSRGPDADLAGGGV